MQNMCQRLVLVLVALAMLSACATPRGSGQSRQILAGAESADATFAVMKITKETLPQVLSWPGQPSTDVVEGWIKRARGPADRIIEAGDKVDISIWDNEESSLITTPTQKVVTLPGMTVSASGSVFLPYIDEVYIAKMTPDVARATIQEKMRAIIPSAQVQLNLESGRKSAVDLVSGVRQPGSFVMPDRDFTILAAIAMGGGIAESVKNPQIRLARAGKLYGVPVATLLKNPELDTTLRGGDKIYVEDESRYFLSLGAVGRETRVVFPNETVTALEAMSIIGGVDESRGNPRGLLILRNYPDSAVRTDGTGPERDRMIFALDLTTADGLFSAGEFPIQHRDLVLVTETPVSSTRTILDIISEVVLIRTRL
jgi:polysaccharide export outer membrane protein